MKVAKIQSSPSFRVKNNKALGIQNYDSGNDYPQKVEEIVRASGTGLSCVRIYAKFIYGHGFNDSVTAEVLANRRGETLDYILKRVCRDYAVYGGFAVHVNYNANYRITEMYHVPFEHCRFEARDRDTGLFDRIGVYDDWTHRDADRKAVKKENIDFIHFFNPDPAVIEAQVEAARLEADPESPSGWPFYKGQIYYFSNAGEKEYPAPVFEAELTNMRSEEGIDNVVGRNVTCNFLPGVMIADINNEPESAEQFEDLQNEFRAYQGDENANNIFLVQVKSKEEVPIKVDLQGQNYDKEFTVSQAYLPDAIGRGFNQPPILRAQDVNTGFSTNEMVNAYKYYNAQTEDERQDVQMVFSRLFRYWRLPGELKDVRIAPLSYNVGVSKFEELGTDVARDVINMLGNVDLTPAQKNKALILIYGFSPEEAANLVNGTVTEGGEIKGHSRRVVERSHNE